MDENNNQIPTNPPQANPAPVANTTTSESVSPSTPAPPAPPATVGPAPVAASTINTPQTSQIPTQTQVSQPVTLQPIHEDGTENLKKPVAMRLITLFFWLLALSGVVQAIISPVLLIVTNDSISAAGGLEYGFGGQSGSTGEDSSMVDAVRRVVAHNRLLRRTYFRGNPHAAQLNPETP